MGKGQEDTCWAGWGGVLLATREVLLLVVGVGPDRGHKAHLDDGGRQASP